MRAYLDNAATTSLHPDVLQAMMPYLLQYHGNASSIHSEGRVVRSAIEKARKQVAQLLNCAPAEVFFTSGGTESDNTAIICTLEAYELPVLITSKLEHHAVLHTAEYVAKKGKVAVHYVQHDGYGRLDMEHLEQLLQANPKALVSIMHANNELGNVNPIQQIGELCQQYGALFHTDAVQTVGKLQLDLQALPVHYLAASAHKFHGPKGIGILFVRSGYNIPPFVHGGAQERNMRGGTENVAGIVGLAKALELAVAGLETTQQHCLELKQHMMERLQLALPHVQYNGCCADHAQSMPHVLNLSLPPISDSDMLLFNLDISGVAASGGSACSSGSQLGSHVIAALREVQNNPLLDLRPAVRFSFSKFSTLEEVDHAVKELLSRYQDQVVPQSLTPAHS